MQSASVLRRVIFLGCCIFALTLPFDFPLKNINFSLPLIKSFLVAQIILLLLIWELLIIFERKIIIRAPSLFVPIVAFFFLHLFSSIIPSERLVWSLKYTFRFFGVGLILLILINFIKEKKQLDYLMSCLFIGAGIAAMFVVIQYQRSFLSPEVQNFFETAQVSPHRIRGLFGWPTVMCVYLGSFIPLLISCLIYKPNKGKFWEKFFYIFLFSIIILSLILSRSRGWVLGLFCGLITLWFLHLINEKDYATFWITIIILMAGFLVFWGSGMYKFIISDLEPSELFRRRLVREALAMIGQYPIRGIGADMFYWKSSSGFRTHNIFLETTVNLGIFGFFILLWMLYRTFRTIAKGIFKDNAFKNSYIQVGIIGSLASFLGHNQVDYFWQIAQIAGLFWILVGAGVCAHNLAKGVRN
jgi:O-antigen ligase